MILFPRSFNIFPDNVIENDGNFTFTLVVKVASPKRIVIPPGLTDRDEVIRRGGL